MAHRKLHVIQEAPCSTHSAAVLQSARIVPMAVLQPGPLHGDSGTNPMDFNKSISALMDEMLYIALIYLFVTMNLVSCVGPAPICSTHLSSLQQRGRIKHAYFSGVCTLDEDNQEQECGAAPTDSEHWSLYSKNDNSGSPDVLLPVLDGADGSWGPSHLKQLPNQTFQTAAWPLMRGVGVWQHMGGTKLRNADLEGHRFSPLAGFKGSGAAAPSITPT